MPVSSTSSGYATATQIREGARWSLATVYSKVVPEAAVVSSGRPLCPQSTLTSAYPANSSQSSPSSGLLPAQQFGSASNPEALRLFPVPPQLPAAPRSPNAPGNSGGRGRRVKPAVATYWQAGSSAQCAYPLATSSASPGPVAPQAAGPAIVERQVSPATGPAHLERQVSSDSSRLLACSAVLEKSMSPAAGPVSLERQISGESIRLPPSYSTQDTRASLSDMTSQCSITANTGGRNPYELTLPAEAPSALPAEFGISPALRQPVKAYSMSGAKSLPAERTEATAFTDAKSSAASRLANRRPGTPDISDVRDRQVMVPKHVAGIRGQVLVSRRLEEEPGDATLIMRNQVRRESLVEPSNSVRRPSLAM